MELKGHIHQWHAPLVQQDYLVSFRFIIHYGEELINLFYRLWNGVERASGKARASMTEVFLL